MACPIRRRGSDNWYYRRTIPADVRAILQKIAKERRPRGLVQDAHQHLSRHCRSRCRQGECAEIAAEVERQLKALREGPKALTAKQVSILSGIVYRTSVQELEDNPGLTSEGWLKFAEKNGLAQQGKFGRRAKLGIFRNDAERRRFSMEQRFGRIVDASFLRGGVVPDDESRWKVIEVG
jgi:hypothetical protein